MLPKRLCLRVFQRFIQFLKVVHTKLFILVYDVFIFFTSQYFKNLIKKYFKNF